MDQTTITIAGLVGCTLAMSVSSVSRQMSAWLQGFENPYNPLRWLGVVMECTLFSGFLIGFVWGWWSPLNPIVAGGVIAGLSYVADEVLALVDSGVRALMSRYFHGAQQQGAAGVMAANILKRHAPPPPQVIEKEVTRGPRPLSEDEAHAIAEAREDGML